MLLRAVPTLPPAPTLDSASTPLLAATRTGVAYVVQHPTARAVTIGLFLVVSFAALDNVALVFLAQDVFQLPATGYGLLASAFGIGMVLGSLVLLPWSTRISPATLLLAGVAVLGLGTLCTGVAPVATVAIVAQGFAGIGNGLGIIANDTLIQRTVPRAILGRVFGMVYGAAWVASSLAYSAAGSLLDGTSPRLVLSIAGGGVLAALCVLWSILPQIPQGE